MHYFMLIIQADFFRTRAIVRHPPRLPTLQGANPLLLSNSPKDEFCNVVQVL